MAASKESCGKAAFDWQRCIFCQKVYRNEKTSCPAESKRTDAGVGYKTVAEIITGFIQLNQLPESLSSLVGFWVSVLGRWRRHL